MYETYQLRDQSIGRWMGNIKIDLKEIFCGEIN
jgi:predicted membrane protein